MGALLFTIAVAVAALEALLLLLLFIPIDYTVSARTGTGVRFRVRWLFGIVRVEHPGPRDPRQRPGPRPQPEPRSRPPGGARGARSVRRLLAIEGLIPRAGTLVADVVRSLGLRRGRIAMRAGTGDPARTGEICGLAGPLLLWSPWSPWLDVEFEPDFAGAVFEAEAEGRGRLVPVRLVGAVGRFAFSRQGLQTVKVLVWNGGR